MGGVLCLARGFLEHPHPSAQVKGLVEIAPGSRVSFLDTDEPSHVPNSRKPHSLSL